MNDKVIIFMLLITKGHSLIIDVIDRWTLVVSAKPPQKSNKFYIIYMSTLSTENIEFEVIMFKNTHKPYQSLTNTLNLAL